MRVNHKTLASRLENYASLNLSSRVTQQELFDCAAALRELSATVTELSCDERYNELEAERDTLKREVELSHASEQSALDNANRLRNINAALLREDIESEAINELNRENQIMRVALRNILNGNIRDDIRTIVQGAFAQVTP